MGLTRTVDPTAEPVTVEEAKAQARIDATTDDALIEGYIVAARELAESYTKRVFVTQTWQQTYDWWFPWIIHSMVNPVQSVSSITYIDGAGDSQTLGASVYTLDTKTAKARIHLAYNETWPTTRAIQNAVTVTLVTGYGAATEVPQSIKLAILGLVGHWYNNREAHQHGVGIHETPDFFRALLNQYVLW